MIKYNVALVTTASAIIEVEAESPEQAKRLVWEKELPYAGAFDPYEFGDWNFGSDLGYNEPDADAWEAVD